jgi:UDP-N-acetylglucosamine/UDP-N-acetylgalactosamine diphosphorylase
MDPKPRGYDKVLHMIKKGVQIPNPLSLDVGDEFNVEQVSAKGVTLYPGCRLYGATTVISADAKLGSEGPVTVDDCQIGPGVELKAGYFKKAVFLEKANMSLGAHVREGCILEEEAGGAHCVGLKQTILFPFVTLGSLINFCDCLMAGGTSRKDHSEVGSSYIHFNFTPDGNKTTPSLFGDVPRGVMLNQPAIFLGGQGGTVGPVRLGFGTVVAAGSIVRHDMTEDNKLIIAKVHPGKVMDVRPHAYVNLGRIIGNNVIYLANLIALEQWYMHVRRLFFNRQEFGPLVYAGALDKLALAKKERISRLKSLAEKIPAHHAAQREVSENMASVCGLFSADLPDSILRSRESFLVAFKESGAHDAAGYIEAIRALPPEAAKPGIAWLQQIIDSLCGRAASLLVSLNMGIQQIEN